MKVRAIGLRSSWGDHVMAWYESADPNIAVLTFAYGLAFFVMAVVAWVQRRAVSGGPLARALPFLALYGLTHGLSEWGEVFVPIQERVLSPDTVHVLQGFHVLLLAASFLMLFLFGAALCADLYGPRWRWATGAGAAVVGTSLALVWQWLRGDLAWFPAWVAAGSAAAGTSGMDLPLQWVEALVRHALVLPGSMLAAAGVAGLVRRPAAVAGEMRRTDLGFYLSLLSFTFAGYGVVGGLIVPVCPVFPGGLLDAGVLYRHLGLHVQVLRVIYGLGLTLIVLRVVTLLDLERQRRLERAERREAVLVERERIAHELHDGVIQTLYGTLLQIETGVMTIDGEPERARQLLKQGIGGLQEAMSSIRGYILDLQPVDLAEPQLTRGLGRIAAEFRANSLLEVELQVGPCLRSQAPPGFAAEVYRIARELLTNVAKHARATRARITVEDTGRSLQLRVIDNGVGMHAGPPAGEGSGLTSVQRRIERWSGRLALEPAQPRGTAVSIDLPWPEDSADESGMRRAGEARAAAAPHGEGG